MGSEKDMGTDAVPFPDVAVVEASAADAAAHRVGESDTVRGLQPHHIQLIGIGSTIGTGLFLGSGRSLIAAGPLGALIAYMAYAAICWGVCLGAGEMGTFLPVRGGFISWAGTYIDGAAAFAIGWNYFYAGTMFAAADTVGVTGLFAYWWPDISPAVWVSISLVVYTCLNSFHVKVYGASEFYFASLKIILILMMILMTFVVMLGGNPAHDRIGFRYWKDPGVWAEYQDTGPLGRFLGFWTVFKVAAYSLGGPEFVAMCASEAVWPRRNIPKATKAVLLRLTLFFFFGILSIGILVPYNDPNLIEAIATAVGANTSPWVVGMKRVGIRYLPDIFNAIVITSALSCANGFCFVSSRVLHSLACRGQAPKIFAKTTKNGIPLYALALVIGIQALSYMQVSNNAATVFGWFINLSSVAQLLNYVAMTTTTLRFRAGMKAQGLDRSFLPWSTRYTVPYTWVCLVLLILIVVTQGWQVFTKGGWDTQSFLTSYFGIAFATIMYFGWKIYHKTKIIGVHEMDFHSHVAEFDKLDEEYRAAYVPPTTMIGRFFDRLM